MDGILNEFYREGGHGVIEGLHELFGRIWRDERVPASWNESRVNERLNEVIERNRVMGEEQNGFRKDRRGEDNMYVVNEMIGRARKDGRKKYLAFLDIEKAYDRVDRRMLCKVLEKVGVSEKIYSENH